MLKHKRELIKLITSESEKIKDLHSFREKIHSALWSNEKDIYNIPNSGETYSIITDVDNGICKICYSYDKEIDLSDNKTIKEIMKDLKIKEKIKNNIIEYMFNLINKVDELEKEINRIRCGD